MTTLEIGLTVAVLALTTALTRFAPSLLFFGDRRVPSWLTYLGKVLPCAVMAMLVVYCLKDISLLSAPYGAPEAIALAVVLGLYIWKKDTLLSVAGGTVSYMLLVQLVF